MYAKYFLQDHLGSTVGLTDVESALTDTTDYDSFGNATNSSFPTRYQFTGREFENETGLQYSRARWYDPQLGRFISEDPIGFGGGDINLYGYVRNSPTNHTDPLGLYEPQSYENPQDIREPKYPVFPYQNNSIFADYEFLFFGDGGLMREEVGEEFFSAKYRAKEKCKSFGERVVNNFQETNGALPGFMAPIGATLLTGGAFANAAGVPSAASVANGWGSTGGVPAGVAAGGLARSFVANQIAVNLSFEAGLVMGSVVSAAGCPCGYQ